MTTEHATEKASYIQLSNKSTVRTLSRYGAQSMDIVAQLTLIRRILWQ